MKQTATDYFYDRMLKLFVQYHEEDVPTIDFSKIITEAYEQSKAIEKEQIIKAHFDAQPFNATMLHNAEQYYKETYNQ
jgi:hypothetical protein